MHLCCWTRQNSLTIYLQWYLISPFPTPLPIPTTTDLSTASAELLLVTAGLVEFFEVHSPANVAHPYIPQKLASDSGGNMSGRERCGGYRCGCHLCRCHPTYVGLISVPFPIWDFQYGLVTVLGLLLWGCVLDWPVQELWAKRGKKSTLPDAVIERIRGKIPFRD